MVPSRLAFAWSIAFGVAAVATLSACASDESDDGATSQSSPSSSSASTGAGAEGGGGGGPGGAGAAGAAGGAGGAGGSGGAGAAGGAGAGGAPQASIVPTIDSFDFFVNCQPIVAADPINGGFIASYENQDVVSGTATVTRALLELDNGAQATDWEFDVTPTDINAIPAGMTVSASHTKVQGSGAGTVGPCSYCGEASTWALKVTWDIAGAEITDVSDASAVLCAF